MAQSPTWSGLTPIKTDLLIHSISSETSRLNHAVATIRTAFIYRHPRANRSALSQDIDKLNEGACIPSNAVVWPWEPTLHFEIVALRACDKDTGCHPGKL